MRCHYLSDLHLEAQSFDVPLPRGDVLIIAGDLCNACCFDPARTDKYNLNQRDRAKRFLDVARANFTHVLFVAGNHEHYDGVFEETLALLRRGMSGILVLDNEVIEIEGVRFFGSTLWTDFMGGRPDAMDAVRRRVGEFFFIKTRPQGEPPPVARFKPEDALRAHEAARLSLLAAVAASTKPLVVVTHHAPSLKGINPQAKSRDLDPAYASDLDGIIAQFDNVPVWVHGHTHVASTYRVGATQVRSNALGFASKGFGARGFSVQASFDIRA